MEARFSVMQSSLENLLSDMAMLAGDIVSPSDVDRSAILKTAIVNAEVLLSQLKKSQGSFPVYPSPREAVDKAYGVQDA